LANCPAALESLLIMQPIRIAMWSGPRNISTAMMRAWGNRADTVVVDEPFYAYYLKATGKQHPGANEVIASGETDWRKVVARLTGPIPKDKRIFFQKQMTHHLLPEVDRQWLGEVTNCFLIRDPREVITSYVKKREDPALEDLGFMQQTEIFDFVRTRGNSIPPVVDAKDVLENPERMLRLLCRAVGVDFTESMLSWPPGLRETDGIWAKHWYGDVARSTSFRPYRAKHVEISAHLREVHERSQECYERLYRYRLR
jgi:sulfotransferase family protein